MPGFRNSGHICISHMHGVVLFLLWLLFLLYRLVIGLTCGLVIVDTVECKCLLVEVNEFNFIG